MSAPAGTSHAQVALAYARRGWPVFPGCYPVPGSSDCGCGGGHAGRDVGKAPIGRLAPNGVKDATTNSATIDRLWRAAPSANVCIALEPARLVLVDPDSPETEAAALSRGLDGGATRESRNRAYLFRRPDGCPAVNLIKLDGDPIDIMATGYVVAYGTHASGCPVRLDPEATPAPARDWTVQLLEGKAAARAAQEATTAARRAERAALYGGAGEPPVRLHQRGLRRWTGELVATRADGKVDRDLSLFFLGLDLAECNASEGAIVAALEDRDEALGWRKFTGRGDAEKRYTEIAEKAVARAVEREPQVPTASPASDATVAQLRTIVEDQDATIHRLQRRRLDQDDRLEVLEDLVHGIDEVLSLTNEEMSASEKVAHLATARWLPYHVSKREASGERPNVSLGYIAKVAGTSKSTLSATYKRFSSNDPEDGAPYRRQVTRSPKWDADGTPVIDPRTGKQAYESELILIPWGDRPATTLRAAADIARARPRLAKHGGSQEAADVRWGRCPSHDNREVRVKGYCPDCGKVVGERTISRQEFDALNEQLAHSDQGATVGDDRYLTGEQVAHSDPRPLSLLDYAASRRAEPPPERCPAPGCRAMEFRHHPDGSWRCLKSGHDPSVYLSRAIIAGGSE